MHRTVSIAILGLFATFASSGTTPIDRVEEDWELVIRSTDVAAAGPQVTTTMCPGPVEDHPDANFNLNYREGATFLAGGLQIEVFDGQNVVTSAESGTASLQTDGETITWTQKLSVSGGSITYLIDSGHSTTWGDFGGANLSVTFGSALSDLSSYSPDVSVSRSGVGWQSDHVTSLRLLQIRYYSGDTLVSTDSTPRDVLLSTTP